MRERAAGDMVEHLAADPTRRVVICAPNQRVGRLALWQAKDLVAQHATLKIDPEGPKSEWGFSVVRPAGGTHESVRVLLPEASCAAAIFDVVVIDDLSSDPLPDAWLRETVLTRLAKDGRILR